MPYDEFMNENGPVRTNLQTTSCGMSYSQVREQRDVHEFMMEFFSVIEDYVKKHSKMNNDNNLLDRFNNLFNGLKLEITRCPEVNWEKTRKEDFN